MLTALLFYVAGRLAFPLAWSHSYVGAVWPPAGIGLGAVLLWGYAVLPGIYLADVLLHYEMFYSSDASFKPVIFFLSPLSSVIRAWLGCVLVKRSAEFPNELVSLRSILLFFFLAGPVAAFVPMVFNTTALLLTGVITEQDNTFTFLTGWLGDCSGIAVFTPLFFIVFNKSHRIWRQRLFALGVPLSVVFLVVAMGYLYAQGKELERLHKLIGNQTESVKNGLQDEFLIKLSTLDRLKDMLALSRTANEPYFHLSAQTDLKQHPDMVHIEWLKAVKINENYRFVRQFSESNKNKSSSSFNSIPELLNTLNIKQDVVTRLIDKQHYLIAVPSYETGLNTCECIKGIAVGVFDIEESLHSAMRRGNYKHIAVKLTDDVSKPKFESVVGFNDQEMADPLGLTKLETVSFSKQIWFLQVTPNKSFLAEYYSWSPWQLLVGGMFLAGFMSIGLLVLTGHTEFVVAQVDKRTLELKHSNLKLVARERQFRKLVQTQSAIVWRADPVTFKFLFVSAEAVSILGHPIKQWLEEPDFWQNHIHEADKEAVLLSLIHI